MKTTAPFLVLPADELAFQATVRVLEDLSHHAAELVSTDIEGATSYHLHGHSPLSGTRLVLRSTGYRIFYGENGRRVLLTDPLGTILHECEWAQGGSGAATMTRARIRLDSGLWAGIWPEATTHWTTLDLPPEIDRTCSPDDLRQMAAQAWNAPLEDVRYFFPDRSFQWEKQGRVTIHLKKDGLYLLEDGTFAHPRFVSYMGAIPWARIDLLNVVELYQSTLPGTGGAAFDLIWGLCDDQRQSAGPIPLRYRGIPTYPAEPAYGLFSAFFRPETPGDEDPHVLFMDRNRANQIAWWPRPDPPWRFVDREQQLCVTVQNGVVQKLTVANDPVGVPYVNPGMRPFASCERTVTVVGNRLLLRDGEQVHPLPVNPVWGVIQESPQPSVPRYPFGWRAFFANQPPLLDPARVYALALLYPDDDSEVGELPTQPFVLEQLYASLNQLDTLPARLKRLGRVLVDGFDAVAAGCVDSDFVRDHTILYRSSEWAQKQAQVLWDQAAQAGRLEAVRETRFLPADKYRGQAYENEYDLIYCWIPFSVYQDRGQSEKIVAAVRSALADQGLAFMIGPRDLHVAFASHGLRLLNVHGTEDMGRQPLLTEHLRLHPRTRLNPALMLFLVEKR